MADVPLVKPRGFPHPEAAEIVPLGDTEARRRLREAAIALAVTRHHYSYRQNKKLALPGVSKEVTNSSMCWSITLSYYWNPPFGQPLL